MKRQFKTKYFNGIWCRFSGILVIAGLAFLMLNGCAPKSSMPPEKTTVSDTASTDGPVIQSAEDLVVDVPAKTLLDMLLEEADLLIEQGKNRQALMILNQAVLHADKARIREVLNKTEQVLIKTGAPDIKIFLERENTAIPRPMLMYWLGIEYCLENDYTRAESTLSDFSRQYPGHQYHEDALDLLSLIKKETFRAQSIGCILPLSGKYKVFGQRALNGFEMALHDMSEKYGRELKLLIEDNRSDPDYSRDCVIELAQKYVAAIAGPMLYTEKAGRRAQKIGIPMVAMTQDDTFPSIGDYLFSNFLTPRMQTRTLVSYVTRQIGIDRLAILYPDEPYGKTHMNLFWDAAENAGARITGVQSYDPKKTDFATVIRKLSGEFYPLPDFLIPEPQILEPETMTEGFTQDFAAAADAENEAKDDSEIILDFDALFIPDSFNKLSQLLPQLSYSDVTDIFLLGTNLWHDERLVDETRGHHSNAVITEGFFSKSSKPLVQKFTSRFKRLYGHDPGYIEAVSYDTACILFETAMDDRVDSRETMKNMLRGKKMFEGVTGKTFFDTNGDVHKELFLLTIKNGKFVEINP